MRDIRKAAVIGSGVMGGGIAAQIANAGVPVLLFDMTRKIASAAVERLLTSEPQAFMSPSNARLVIPLGVDADLAMLAGCDWIVEAIVEKLEAKRDIYEKIEAHAPGAIVSSNTSTIPLADLTEGASPSFKQRFLITHFFNPPRYMRLLEIVRGPETSAGSAESIAHFADRRLGKSIVNCKDRPGFIANRLGCFWSVAAMAAAFEQGLTVEDADAVMGKPFGMPKTGVFGLADLVGLDLMPHVNANLAGALEPGDLFHRVNVPLPFVARMIADGLTGRKGKGGFYRLNREHGKRKEAIDLKSGAYRPAEQAVLDDAVPLLEQDNAQGRYARAVWSKVFAYAGLLVGDAADDLQSIDEAMRLGYNWQRGPFELMDRIGADKVIALLKAEGLPVAPIFGKSQGQAFYRDGRVLDADGSYAPLSRAEGIVLLADFKRTTQPLLSSPSAALWDMGGGIGCFELLTKMNTIDGDVLDLLAKAIETAEQSLKAMVIYGDGPHVSAGANLSFVAAAIKDRQWNQIEQMVARGQSVFKRVKYARVPIVGAAAGLALGGGCELLLHCAAIQAHAELNMGLVEAGVGLIPGWGGNGELMLRLLSNPELPKGPMPAIARAFEAIVMVTVSRSAQHAMELGYLRTTDQVTMNRDRLLADARARALALAENYRPPEPPSVSLPGPSAAAALMLQVKNLRMLGRATSYDVVVAEALSRVLTGGTAEVTKTTTERQHLDLERDAFMTLVRRPETLARIVHMLDTGKPLRN